MEERYAGGFNMSIQILNVLNMERTENGVNPGHWQVIAGFSKDDGFTDDAGLRMSFLRDETVYVSS